LAKKEIDDTQRRLQTAKLIMFASLLVVFLGGSYAVLRIIAPTTSPADKVGTRTTTGKGHDIDEDGQAPIPSSDVSNFVSTDELRSMGATAEELEALKHFSIADLTDQKGQFLKVLGKHLMDRKWSATPFGTDVPGPGFVFPTDITVGAISVDHSKPVLASGYVPVPAGKSVCFYLSWAAVYHPQILNKFGPNDLNGLEVVSSRPSIVIGVIKNWSKLQTLCFFNSLLKAMPSFEKTDESLISDRDLPALGQLTGLRSLGLCGNGVTGQAILEMPLLKNLEAIKLKRVKDIDPLIEALPALDNIKEVWLIGQGTTDAQIEILSNMKNLTTLKIMRSKLTPAALKYFREMSALKHLTLDRNNWTEAEKAKFISGLSGCDCRFETLLDDTYWQVLPHTDASHD
jgi:hypothetical protein